MDDIYTNTGRLKVTKDGKLVNFWLSKQDASRLNEISKVMRRSRSDTLRELIILGYEKLMEREQ